VSATLAAILVLAANVALTGAFFGQ
jgi:hypothetical protein